MLGLPLEDPTHTLAIPHGPSPGEASCCHQGTASNNARFMHCTHMPQATAAYVENSPHPCWFVRTVCRGREPPNSRLVPGNALTSATGQPQLDDEDE
jgi:hypothetical protein